MEPHHFETMVCRLYRDLGYAVLQTPRARDGGRDAIMERNGSKALLEVKRYNRSKAGRPDLQKFYSAVITDNADQGIFVSLGGFANGARETATALGIETVDLSELLALMREAGWHSPANNYLHLCTSCGNHVTLTVDDQFADTCACGAAIANKVTNWHLGA